MKDIKNLKLTLLAILTCMSTSAFADDSLKFSGYGILAGDFESTPRALKLHSDGTGINDDARGILGTLGNNYWHDNFVALTVNKKWTGNNGQWANYTVTLENYGNGDTHTGENYAQFGGLSFLPKDSTIWIGKKSLGKSVPVINYAAKSVEFDSAVGYNSKDFDIAVGTSNGDHQGTNALDIEYRLGKLGLNLTYVDKIDNAGSSAKGTSESLAIEYKADRLLGIVDGSTTYRAQVGKGVASKWLNYNRITDKDDTSMKFTIDSSVNLGKDINIKPIAVFESTDHNGGKVETNITGAIATSKKITNNFSMLFEAAVSATQNREGIDGVSGTAYKVAAGPALQLEVNEWIRPIAKFSVAVAGGDKEITLLDKKSEIRVGYAMETWF